METEQEITAEQLAELDQETEQEQQENLEEYFDLDTPLRRENVGVYIDKKELLDNSIEVELTEPVLFKNKFKGWVLAFKYNGTDRNINISKENYNTLIDLFKPKVLADLIGKKVKITGKPFSAEIKGEMKTGVTLELSPVEN